MWDTFVITPFVNALLWIYTVFGQNFGIAIILFTILIRLITYPLTAQQLKGTAAMQNLQSDPDWQAIQKKYKDDKEKLAQEQMRIYKEKGISPFGACLPTLIQFPIIIALYQSIIRTLGASPLDLLGLTKEVYPGLLKVGSLIPLNSDFLWMKLGQPDNSLTFGILPFGLPILAVIVVITTYVQSKLMTPPTTGDGGQGAQMTQMMNLWMPFFMGYLALTLSSGLALYFVASNVIGIVQYAALGKANFKNLLPGRKPVAAQKPGIINVKPTSKPANKPTPKPTPRPSNPPSNNRPGKQRIQTKTKGQMRQK